jgi:hypothetical protein
MNNWKLVSIILAILLVVSILWSVQQRNHFEKQVLKTYSLEHAQLAEWLKGDIGLYEKEGNQIVLSESLLQKQGFVLNIRPAVDTIDYRTFDFDYTTARVLYEVHLKAHNGQINDQDLERLKTLQQLLQSFTESTLNNLEHKTVKDYENDFDQFMKHYETKKDDL